MNSKTSYSNKGSIISLPLIKENLKRFWGIAVLSFAGYFLGGVFPIIAHYSNLTEDGSYWIQEVLKGTNPFFFILLYTIPIFTGILIYRYMQTPGSAAVMHSLPLTRKNMFHSNFLSGLILIWLPIIANGIILLSMVTPVMHNVNGVETNIFTYSAVCSLMGIYLLTSLVLFSITVFSSMVTGSSLLQALLSLGLPVFLSGTFLMLYWYFSQFVYGYYASLGMQNLIFNISPAIKILSQQEFTLPLIAWYVVSFLAIYITSFYLYQKRNMEKAGETIVFRFMRPAFKWLAAFVGMSGLALFFQEIVRDGSIAFIYLGAFIGALIAYIIAEIIVQKSMHIFRNLKGFLLYAVVACLFFVAMATDITGYEKRIPELSQVESVIYTQWYNEGSSENFEIKDVQAIEAMSKFHATLIEEKSQYMHASKWDAQPHVSKELVYILKNGKQIIREYTMDNEFYALNPYAKQMYECPSAKKQSYDFLADDYQIPSSILLEKSDLATLNPVASPVISNPDKMASLLDALKKDASSETFEESLSGNLPLAYVRSLYPKSHDNNSDKSSSAHPLTENNVNTINWLKAEGLYDSFTVTADQISYIELEKISNKNSVSITEQSEIFEDTIPTSTKDKTVFTDKVKIEKILQTIKSKNRNYSNYYMVHVHTVNGAYLTFYYDSLPNLD